MFQLPKQINATIIVDAIAPTRQHLCFLEQLDWHRLDRCKLCQAAEASAVQSNQIAAVH